MIEFVCPANTMMEPGQVLRLIQNGHICLQSAVQQQLHHSLQAKCSPRTWLRTVGKHSGAVAQHGEVDTELTGYVNWLMTACLAGNVSYRRLSCPCQCCK